MKKPIRNKQIKVRGITLYPNGDALPDELECIITNDEKGKTITTMEYCSLPSRLNRLRGI